ncbi:MAG: sulfurtransferase complex subunit TusD [Methylovulum sp.]|jgi:tRNA 2-thiouridine synthesizing protein D|nr:sulfurtransferase complex subunit TusD [Methylovulum sp.]
MNFSIQINTSPYHSNAGCHAYHFILSALQQGHTIAKIFFFHDGIYHALKYTTPPDDELSQTLRWSKLANEFNIELLVCISAAQRRGLLSMNEAHKQGKNQDDLASGFQFSGLGQLIEATLMTDRFIIFG